MPGTRGGGAGHATELRTQGRQELRRRRRGRAGDLGGGGDQGYLCFIPGPAGHTRGETSEAEKLGTWHSWEVEIRESPPEMRTASAESRRKV